MTLIPNLGFPDSESIFEAFGGSALGLHVANTLRDQVDTLTTPPYELLPLPLDVSLLRNRLTELGSVRVVCKASGPREDYSIHSARGSNSSLEHGVLSLSPEGSLGEVCALAERAADRGARAIILQHVVPDPGPLGLIHGEVDGGGAEIEAGFEGEGLSLYGSSRPGVVDWKESTEGQQALAAVEHHVDVAHLLDLHWEMYSRLGFPLATEGFYKDRGFVLVQIRPTPPDRPINPGNSSIIDSLLNVEGARPTRFVWGCFDETGLAADPRHADGTIVVADRRPIWENAFIRERLTASRPTVVIDTAGGFRLAHHPSLMPPPGPLRENFRVISAAGWDRESILGSRVRVVSDGRRGVFRAMS